MTPFVCWTGGVVRAPSHRLPPGRGLTRGHRIAPSPHERHRRRGHRCFVALFARLWYLQVMEAPQLEVQATENRTRTVAVEAPRGRILDRNGTVIVDNRTSLVVTVDRRAHNKLKAADRDALVSKLAATFTEFGTPTKIEAIEKRLADLQYDDLQPVPVAIDVSQDLMVYLSEQADEFPDVGVERESVTYRSRTPMARPATSSATSGASPRRSSTPPSPGTDPNGVVKAYQPDSTIGLAGIEAAYEKDLRGTPGTEVLEIDAKNRLVGTPVVPAAPARQRHPAQHRHRRADEGRGGPARAAHRGTGRQRSATTRRCAARTPRRGVGRHRPQHRCGDRPPPTPTTTPPSSSTASARSATPSSPTPTASAPSSTAPSPASTPRARPSSWSPPPRRSTTATSAPASTINDTGVFEVGGQERRGAPARALTVSSDVFFYRSGAGWTQMARAPSPGLGSRRRLPPQRPPGSDRPTTRGQARLRVAHPGRPARRASYVVPRTTHPREDSATGEDIVATPAHRPAHGARGPRRQLAGAYSALANGGTVYRPHVTSSGDPTPGRAASTPRGPLTPRRALPRRPGPSSRASPGHPQRHRGEPRVLRLRPDRTSPSWARPAPPRSTTRPTRRSSRAVRAGRRPPLHRGGGAGGVRLRLRGRRSGGQAHLRAARRPAPDALQLRGLRARPTDAAPLGLPARLAAQPPRPHGAVAPPRPRAAGVLARARPHRRGVGLQRHPRPRARLRRLVPACASSRSSSSAPV